MLLLSVEHKSEHSRLVDGNYLLKKKRLWPMTYCCIQVSELSRKCSKDVNMSASPLVGTCNIETLHELLLLVRVTLKLCMSSSCWYV